MMWNMDETALTYAIGPTHMLVPEDAIRAAGTASNTEAQITLIVCVNGWGWYFLPSMLIMKHTASSEAKPDQTGMRVIDILSNKPDFTAAEH